MDGSTLIMRINELPANIHRQSVTRCTDNESCQHQFSAPPPVLLLSLLLLVDPLLGQELSSSRLLVVYVDVVVTPPGGAERCTGDIRGGEFKVSL